MSDERAAADVQWDPLDHFAELVVALDEGRAPAAASSSWFVAGVLRAIVRAESLDVGLGLSGVGRRSLPRRLQGIKRDAHLADAVAAVALDERTTDWQRCKRLAPLVRAFVADTWPRTRRLQQPPADWPAWKRSVFHAAQTDLDLPSTPRGLFYVVQAMGAYSFHTQRSKLLARLLGPGL